MEASKFENSTPRKISDVKKVGRPSKSQRPKKITHKKIDKENVSPERSRSTKPKILGGT